MEDEAMEGDEFGAADWMKAIGGVLFFVAGLLTWWNLEFRDGLSVAKNAFDYDLTGIVPYIIFVGIGVLTIVARTESLRLPDVVVHPLLFLVAAAVGTVLVGYRFFDDGYDNLVGENSVTRGIGLYLAAVAALLVLAGCVMTFREFQAMLAESEEDEDAIPSPRQDATPPRTQRPPLP
jgi:hypothetical protein